MSRPRRRLRERARFPRAAWAVLQAVAAVVLWAAAAAAQGAARQDTSALRRHEFAALAVYGHPWSTVVAITLVFPRGSSDDPQSLSGAAHLLGQVVRERVARGIEPGGAEVTVEVARTHTVFQALAVPGSWREVYEELLDAVFRGPLQGDVLEAQRREMLGAARFETGAPVREFQTQFYRVLAGRNEAWSRGIRGTPESLQRISLSELEELRSRMYQRSEAVVTLVGAVETGTGLRVYPGRAGSGNDPIRLGPGAGRRLAWDDGTRQRLEGEVTNSWIGAAFPVPRDVPRTLLEFVRHRVAEELNPDPPDPGLFGSEVRIEEAPGGTILVIETAVLPEAQRRWEERVVQLVEQMGERHRDAGYFRFHRRRFRSAQLTAEGLPEVEGLRMALDLLREGRVREVEAEVQAMEAGQVVRAIDAFGEPRMLAFGPNLGNQQP